jgi:hypothetical protein
VAHSDVDVGVVYEFLFERLLRWSWRRWDGFSLNVLIYGFLFSLSTYNALLLSSCWLLGLFLFLFYFLWFWLGFERTKSQKIGNSP